MSLREKAEAAFKLAFPVPPHSLDAHRFFCQGYIMGVCDQIRGDLDASRQSHAESSFSTEERESHQPCWACGVRPKEWFEAQERAAPADVDRTLIQPATAINEPGIICAAEGVTLEPGEYEVMETLYQKSPLRAVGQRFVVRTKEAPRDETWSVWLAGECWRVTAVRRVEPAPTPSASERYMRLFHLTTELNAVSKEAQEHASARAELIKERDELRSKVSKLEEQGRREIRAWKLDVDRLTECRDQLSIRDSEIARLREELEAERRACTQLHCAVSNAWSNFRFGGGMYSLPDLCAVLDAIAKSDPHAKQADAMAPATGSEP